MKLLVSGVRDPEMLHVGRGLFMITELGNFMVLKVFNGTRADEQAVTDSEPRLTLWLASQGETPVSPQVFKN